MTTLVENSDSAILAMTEYEWITYLTSNRMCPAIVASLLANKYLFEAFNQSIVDYKRDDFTSDELPAVCVYVPKRKAMSRFYHTNGEVHFDVFLPIRLERDDTSAVFETLGKYFCDAIQSISFFNNLHDKLVPLPPISSPIYKDVLRYKQQFGSPLVDFAKEIQVNNPNIINLLNIGDVWKMEIITSYNFDMMNYYCMLEDFGINGDYDPNKIIYEILQDFSVDAEPLIT